MPLLNVAEVLTDPDFALRLKVIRRKEIIDEHGRSQVEETVYHNVVGVQTRDHPNDLERQTDFEVTTSTISFITKFPLHVQVPGYKPDVVVLNGNHFLVRHLDPYPRFGEGFYEAVCESMDRNDNASRVPRYR